MVDVARAMVDVAAGVAGTCCNAAPMVGVARAMFGVAVRVAVGAAPQHLPTDLNDVSWALNLHLFPTTPVVGDRVLHLYETSSKANPQLCLRSHGELDLYNNT